MVGRGFFLYFGRPPGVDGSKLVSSEPGGKRRINPDSKDIETGFDLGLALELNLLS
jgi:hypothetical protein